MSQIYKESFSTGYSISFPTNPEYSGPGGWYFMHTTALNVDEGKKSFNYGIEVINDIANNFPCKTCMGHAQTFIRNYPPTLWRGKLFEWTFRFHNSVNSRLNKLMISLTQARNMYKTILNPERNTVNQCLGCGTS